MKEKITSRSRKNRNGQNLWRNKIPLIIFLLIITSGLVFLYIKSGFVKPFPKIVKDNNAYHLACPYDTATYISNLSLYSHKIHAKAVVIPHHLLAKDLIIKTLDSISSDYQTIFLIGPNHKNLGKVSVQISKANWRTKFGQLSPDLEVVDYLEKNSDLDISEENFNTEHSICGLVSFVKIYFPQAKIVPIILKSNTYASQVDKLVSNISISCNNCLLIASVDFSHEVSSDQAKKNDQISADILINQKLDDLKKIEVDSLPTLQTLLLFLKEQNAREVQLVDSSNSYKISGINPESVTSYISMIYYTTP